MKTKKLVKNNFSILNLSRICNTSFAENNLNNSKQLLTTAEISKTNRHFPKFVVKNFPNNPTTF